MSRPVFNRKDQACVNTLRLLSADMVEAARSGHPGLPLGAAPMAYILWSRFLKHDPKDPQWPDRDRFILSPGHGSALLYAWLHLAGYGLTMEELKAFRQWGGRTPGHPEYGLTPGVEASTGPLGCGFAMGVGLAIAEKMLARRFNRPQFPIFNWRVYALVSDGDLMEGVSAEAASLAGSLGLDNLICLYDDNRMTIEGSTDLTFTEDVRARFSAYGWQVIVVAQGDDLGSIYQALENARAETERPSLLMIRTKLGAGSPKENTPQAHGEPLGPEALRALKRFYGYPEEQSFAVDPRVYDHFKKLAQPHQRTRADWLALRAEYAKNFPAEAAELERRLAGRRPEGWARALPEFKKGGSLATRAASGRILNALAGTLPELTGGSADLAPSNKTEMADLGFFGALSPEGRNFHFGVREAAMGAAANGLALAGGLSPFVATFLVFSDFMRPALRLAAMMKLPVVFVFTHDSVGVGEDGPTHQPVEQLACLRALPGLTVIRPADAYETSAAWQAALTRGGPVALALSRQDLPILSPEDFPNIVAGALRGGYVLSEAAGGEPELIIIASGSEVSLALGAQKILAAEGRRARVVSLPSWEIFDEQPQAYRDSVLPPGITRRLAAEAGLALGWNRYVGPLGRILSIENFGSSAPADRLFRELGFTPEKMAALAAAL